MKFDKRKAMEIFGDVLAVAGIFGIGIVLLVILP